MVHFESSTYVELVLKNWQYRELNTKSWKNSKPGEITEIYADLLANKEIPDPFMDMNEKEVQWVAEKDWEYENSFDVPSSSSNLKNHELIFEGLDTFASVYLNGKHILDTDNMFKQFKVNVSDSVKFGARNCLKIVFKSALLTGRKLEKQHGRLNCFNGEPSRLYVRKAQYHYGWDWGPILMSCGPYKPVKFISYDSRIEDVYVKPIIRDDNTVLVDVISEIITNSSEILNIEVSDPSGNVVISKQLSVSNTGSFKETFEIEDAELWYPLGVGKQPLYEFKLTFGNQNVIKNIGLRKVELVQEEYDDQEGTSFYFRVNGVPVYIAGSNWIPGHSILTLLTDDDYRKWLKLMVDGNQNMIRVWAGGYYESDFFYEECDRLGVMVWQDFMFACGQYPGYPDFLRNVKDEAIHQIKRLRNHCSMALYAGNNEDYQVAEQRGLEWDRDDKSGDYTKTNFPARTIYERILPDLVSELCAEVPYHPGSPWGGNGTADPTIGDIHQWNVWHGNQEKYQDWYKLGGRFVSEFGMEALPCRKTYEDCITDPTELYPQSEMIDHHNKADGFERRLALYVIENIKVEGLDLDSWIYATQLMQLECLGYAYRCWRRQWRGDGQRYSGGAIVWQINDCWPVASWALVDFYRRPKLAYYSVKRESREVGVGMYRIEKKSTPDEKVGTSSEGPPHDYSKSEYYVDFWGVNSSLKDVPAVLKVDLYDVTNGKKIDHLPDKDVVLKANQTTELISNYHISNKIPVVVYSRFISKSDGSIIASAADWPQPLKYLKFNNREVKVKVEDDKVILSSNKPIKGVEILLENDLFLEDNGFDIFPGDTKVVGIKGLKKTDKVNVRYYMK